MSNSHSGESSIDIIHLTRFPPFVAGSYNRTIGAILERMDDFSQAAVSFWDSPVPEGADLSKVRLVNAHGLTFKQRLYLSLPTRVRSSLWNGITGRDALVYLWKVTDELRRLKPKLVICYDHPNYGMYLRQNIDWECRLVLSQRGLTYNLSPKAHQQVYSLRSFDVVHVLSSASYDWDRPQGTLYEPEVAVMPNGVDGKRFTPVNAEQQRGMRSQWGLPLDKKIVLLLMRQVPKKGAHVIVTAWKEIIQRSPNAFLWIVGGGDERYLGELKRIVARLGLEETVRFQGVVEGTQTHTCYQAADLYVFPTLCTEGHALSLLEAMSCGVACVASEHDTAKALYQPDEVYFVSQPNVINAFVDPISTLLHDDRLRSAYAQKGYAAVQATFTQERAFERYRQFYRQQLALVSACPVSR